MSPPLPLSYPLHRVRFLVDASLNRLTRWLRAIGVDAEARDGYGISEWRARRGGGGAIVTTPLDDFIAFANDDRRVVLTRDAKTLARRATCVIQWIADTDITEAYTAIAETFALTVRHEDLMSRCAVCNNDAYRKLAPAEVRALNAGVSELVLSRLSHFWQCTRGECAKLFWEGGRFDLTRDRYSELFD